MLFIPIIIHIFILIRFIQEINKKDSSYFIELIQFHIESIKIAIIMLVLS
jgi:hypothetical protein